MTATTMSAEAAQLLQEAYAAAERHQDELRESLEASERELIGLEEVASMDGIELTGCE